MWNLPDTQPKPIDNKAKQLRDEDEYIYILPEISFIKAEIGENAYLKLGDIPVVIDEKISFIGEEFSFNKKSKFTLLDLLCCLFEEMPEYVKEGEGIAY